MWHPRYLDIPDETPRMACPLNTDTSKDNEILWPMILCLVLSDMLNGGKNAKYGPKEIFFNDFLEITATRST